MVDFFFHALDPGVEVRVDPTEDLPLGRHHIRFPSKNLEGFYCEVPDRDNTLYVFSTGTYNGLHELEIRVNSIDLQEKKE